MEFTSRLEEISSTLREFLSISEEDIRNIKEVHNILGDDGLKKVVSEATDILLSDKESLEIVKSVGLTREVAENLLESCVRNLFSESFNYRHSLKISKVGLAHCKSGVSIRQLLALMGVLLIKITKVLIEKGRADLIPSLEKGTLWSVGIISEAYSMAVALSIEKTAGISKDLLDKSVRLSASRVYEEVGEALSKELEGSN